MTFKLHVLSIALLTVVLASASPALAQCTYTLSKTSVSFAVSGGAFDVTVTAAAGCTWTSVSQTSWIGVSAGAAGNGNGTTTVFAIPNSDTAARVGFVTIAGQRFTVTQPGTLVAGAWDGGWSLVPMQLNTAKPQDLFL